MASRSFRFFLLTGVSALILPQAAPAQILTGFDAPPASAQPEESALAYNAPLTMPGPAAAPLEIPIEPASPPVMTAPALAPEDSPVAMQAAPLTNFETTEDPVNLDAESLTHDDATNTIVASGNVFLTQAGRILRADQIAYNLDTDTAVASGHVVLNEENGTIHYADNVKFNDKLKNGFVKSLKVYMEDGSRFTAVEGERTDGNTTVMEDAAYTACEPCKANPEKPPLWQIRAAEVIHDEKDRQIAYKHARFEARGVPIAYVPYFSHPDGTIKRKSGLLAPTAGYRSELGAFVTNKFYWAIAPDKDATIGVMAMTKESPLYEAEWRQRWEKAKFEISGGITESQRTDRAGGANVKRNEELRGHVFAEGRWDINEKWRSGLNVEWASDDQYMRQYDFSNEHVLENELYAERFSGRNYAVGRLLTFQDVRVLERQEDQPAVLPEIIASFKGEPNSVPVLGGRWGVDASFLGLQRGGDEQDVNRFSLAAGWNRRLVSDYGLVTTADVTLRGDVYNTRDYAAALPGQDETVTAARFFPQMHIESSYPLAKPMEKAQMRIEPVAALTFAPNIDTDDDIPNEDSQDAQIDVSNIFDANRFPGLDRVEDQSRVTYGLRSGVYGYDGSYANVFLGQSHRIQDDDNPFPSGSGLDKQNSDIVGQISAASPEHYSFDYRFQLASDTLGSQRHEIEAGGDWRRFFLTTRYFYATELGGTSIDESREQASLAGGYYLSPEWRVQAGATQDLGSDAPGLRKAYLGLDYFGQCLSWSLVGKRNYTNDASGESDTEVIFKIGLKNLGGFERSDLRDDYWTD